MHPGEGFGAVCGLASTRDREVYKYRVGDDFNSSVLSASQGGAKIVGVKSRFELERAAGFLRRRLNPGVGYTV